MIIQGIGTIRLRGGIMLQVTRRILSLSKVAGLRTNGRPRQKVMITAGRRSRDVPSRQGWPSEMARQERMARPSQPSRQGQDGQDGKTGSNEDIRMDGFHYYSRCGQLKLYFLTVSLLTRLYLLVLLVNRIDLCQQPQVPTYPQNRQTNPRYTHTTASP
jgi:hypothetical protein